ncbi:MAG: putative metal-binding motif-containing protein [Deltaproteobacteria bacterium]|nr:putative metal-binding motif-containing protein [Deltaproteobacteria bacterium]
MRVRSLFASAIIFSSLLVASSSGATVTLDVSQTSGGYSQGFTYNGTRWVEQTFVPIQNNISQIKLRMLCNLLAVCGQSYETISVVIQNSSGSPVSSEQTIPLSTLGSSFAWVTINFSNFFQVTPGQTYKIRVYYNGYQLDPNPVFYWDRSTSNVYSSGSYQMYGNISGTQDFTFQTYYESTACYDSTPLTCGVGACQRTVPTCLNGQRQTCTPGTPTTEVCNGIDDNCNMQTDEGLGSTTCGTGVCQRTVQNCSNGSPQICAPGSPTAEVCNNLDDNCNGVIDDGLGSTTCGTGDCQRTVQNCLAGGIPQTCTPGLPTTEICDGRDNNCDGRIDEGFTSTQTTCGVGECRRTVTNCVNGQTQTCTPGLPTTEICNGLDDNCNGTADEGLNTPVTCGVGACQRTVSACLNGVVQSCMPGSPVVETCNGIDDNCNGQTDEGFGTTTCGVGACQRTVNNCQSGRVQTCTPGQPSTEICGNNIDENCNGAADDVCPMSCPDSDGDGWSTNAACRGIADCNDNNYSVNPGQREVCGNNLDDNCNGQIDEDCGSTPVDPPPPLPPPTPPAPPPPPQGTPAGGGIGNVEICQSDKDCSSPLRCIDQVCTSKVPDAIVMSGPTFQKILQIAQEKGITVPPDFLGASVSAGYELADKLSTVLTIKGGVQATLQMIFMIADDFNPIWVTRVYQMGEVQYVEEFTQVSRYVAFTEEIDEMATLLRIDGVLGIFKANPALDIALSVYWGLANMKGDTIEDKGVSFVLYGAGQFIGGFPGAVATAIDVTTSEPVLRSILLLNPTTGLSLSGPLFYPSFKDSLQAMSGFSQYLKSGEEGFKNRTPERCGSVQGILDCFFGDSIGFLNTLNYLLTNPLIEITDMEILMGNTGLPRFYVDLRRSIGNLSGTSYFGATVVNSSLNYTCNLPYEPLALNSEGTARISFPTPLNLIEGQTYTLLLGVWNQCSDTCPKKSDGCYEDGCCQTNLGEYLQTFTATTTALSGDTSTSPVGESGGCSLLVP